ncbi:fumarylacetoacetate hydrolase family protein [Rhodovulum sp. YNF3179]|uniref:fumarylacetoacetate hydrolase family protein n=1 Tax=Rhodovulum sp. YNF3179 TaxID=3425127 RepID=UPI003D344B4F
MRICTFLENGRHRLGLVDGDTLLDALAAGGSTEIFADTVAFITAGDDGIAAAKQLLADGEDAARRPFAECKLGAPVLPSTVLCSGSNYRSHNAEKANTPLSGKEPEFFIKTADCVIGPEEPIIHDPALSQKLDCETELAVVIGKPGRHIPVDRAMEHVFGYTVANDVTARDRQVRRSPEGLTWYELGRGKAFDSSLPLGPVIVTAEEIPDPQALNLSTRINGELRQSASTADMIWNCAELIHFFSINFTLRPGMLILTGTPAGTAWSVDADLGGTWKPEGALVPATRYCLPGDIVESTIDQIGTLKNPVSAARNR